MQFATSWSNAWRGALALIVALPLTVAAFVAGLGAQPWAWVAAPLVLAVLTGALATALWSGRQERRLMVAVAVVVGALLGTVVWFGSPPGPRLLAGHVEAIELPSGTRLVEEHTSGNVLCFDYCPSVSRSYHVEGEPGPVAAGMEDALRRSGLHVTRRDADGTSFSNGEGDDVRLRVDIVTAYRYPATEDHPEPERIPGVTEITITATARQPL